MGYIFLSVISGSIKGFFGKKISDKTGDLKSAVFANLIRMPYKYIPSRKEQQLFSPY